MGSEALRLDDEVDVLRREHDTADGHPHVQGL
jgi:hypothetical protein